MSLFLEISFFVDIFFASPSLLLTSLLSFLSSLSSPAVTGLPGLRIAELSAMGLRISWCLLAVATIVNAVPAPAPQNTPSPSPTGNPQACGQIGPAAAAFLAQNPRAGTSNGRE